LGGKVHQFAPLAACEGPMVRVAQVVKLFISVLVCVGGLMMCARPILAAFGYADALPQRGSSA
jgi:hypothetical protein